MGFFLFRSFRVYFFLSFFSVKLIKSSDFLFRSNVNPSGGFRGLATQDNIYIYKYMLTVLLASLYHPLNDGKFSQNIGKSTSLTRKM